MGISDEKVVAVIMVGGPPNIPNLAQIYLVGFYEERELSMYVLSISTELRVPVRYLREDKPHDSAGGLYNFRDLIMEDNLSHIFLLNCDVCCSFPLPEMLGNLLHNVVAAGANLVLITRGIEKTTRALVSELKAISKEVEDCELADVAAVSPGNNNEIGNMIAEAMSKVG
ncbi:hypothetical protein CXB51_025876 [Gossypium anomalum]|uniref:Uncharacterized protein n=1 Tax=Gossypium anomalum TaxID=47600 RepID=A0A8J6CRX2_9ROSI|nr:hypothetical protein CXB51_025876 [Gossypium anomalum]